MHQKFQVSADTTSGRNSSQTQDPSNRVEEGKRSRCLGRPFEMNPSDIVSDLLSSILDLQCAIETSSTTTTTTTAADTTSEAVMPSVPEPTEGVEGEKEKPQPTEGVEGEKEKPQPTESVEGEKEKPQPTESVEGEKEKPQLTESVEGEKEKPQPTEGVDGGTQLPKPTTEVGGGAGKPTTEVGGAEKPGQEPGTTDEDSAGIVLPGEEGVQKGPPVPAVAGAVAGVAGAAALLAGGYMVFSHAQTPARMDIEMEAEDTRNAPREVSREAQNPMESADYGEYRL
eukprot:Gregarina_sp_Poly_1__1745@NODE_1450_length_4124_cov_47_742913_g962_i0_p2_GENE_NODE_1450_length_4124_cov_47_742913_g962_i0NODE_1450_length_4124_cov_47_742913_g962_i0_p2_ORF_typecomplete_len284_score60_16PAP_PilO/PF06864_12/0_019DUF3042/PF11240_8/0_13DUF3439/PF11921_8/3_1_NODE_1450_length_4124_cov_47_742913_g962_i01561007